MKRMVTGTNEGSTAAWRTRLLWLAVVLLCATAAAGMIRPLLTLPHRVPVDYNEGWNAMWADVAVAAEALYPPPDSAVANNYPPLSFFAIGAWGHLLGDNIVAGRIVALLSLWAIALGIFLWLRVTGSPARLAVAGAVLFPATLVSFAPQYIAMNDPQMLAHAVMTAAMVVLWRGAFTTRSVVIAALLVVAAGFIKQVLLPMPLAATLWLAIWNRARLPAWLITGAVAALILFAVTCALYGFDFLHDLIASRTYSLQAARVVMFSALKSLRPLLILGSVAAASAWWSRRSPGAPASGRVSFALLYLLAAAILDGLAAGGAGVDANLFFDLLIAASLCAALGLEAIESTELIPRKTAAVVALLAVWALAGVVTLAEARRMPREIAAITQIRAREAATRSIVQVLQQEGDGHAACEDLALCYWAHEPFEVDLFNYGQKLKTHMLDNASCEALFGTGRIQLLELNSARRGGKALLTQECFAVIQAHFAVIPSPWPEWTLLRNTAPGLSLAAGPTR